MDFSVGTYGLGLVAGILSTLSPCVLPIVPILLGSASNAHPKAPLALAMGLAVSYAVIGTALAWAGANLSVDTGVFRQFGAVLFGVLGFILVSAPLQRWFASSTAGISNVGNTVISKWQLDSLTGQFVVGLVLGLIWSPCVGPTLGAAVVLASQGSHLPQVALLMGVFGMGAALPVVVLAYVGRGAMMKLRGSLMQVGKAGKLVLGAAMLALSVLILTGLDKSIEAWLVDVSPAWLTSLTTRF